jgi:SNF2 family DNA or RNA helicase
MAVVYLKSADICIRFDKNEKWRLEGCPGKAEKISLDKPIYALEPVRGNIDWVYENFSTKEIAPKVDEFMRQKLEEHTPLEPFPASHQFRIHPPFDGPMEHQRRVLDMSWGKKEFAVFHEMGCGKSLTAISLASARWEASHIQGLLVVCPTAIKFNWQKEIDKHWPETSRYSSYVLYPDNMSRVHEWMVDDVQACKILVVGVESLSQGTAWTVANRFLEMFPSMMVVDESSRIKTPYKYDKKQQKVRAGVRTYRCVQLGKLASYRLAMTGTSVTQGLQDLYSQFEFLNPNIIGSPNYYAFRNAYCIMGGAMGKKIVGYQNTQKLFRLLAPYVDVCRLDDVADIPEFATNEIVVSLTQHQRRLMKQLKEEMVAEYGDRHLAINTALEYMLRAQQIVGGFMPIRREDAHLLRKSESKYESVPLEESPKLDAALEWAQEIPHKGIIWARFVPEIQRIKHELDKLDIDCVTFYGDTAEEERQRAVREFEDPDSPVKIFLGNPATGGIGIDLIQGTRVLYYSNSFSLETRLQSMARSRRLGQTKGGEYTDLISNAQIDLHIVRALNRKMSISDYAREMLDDPGNLI